MGTKCLKNRILVPNFTYKLTQKSLAKLAFLLILGINSLGKGFFIPTVAGAVHKKF